MIRPINVSKGREKKWLAVKMDDKNIPDGCEHNCVLRRGIEGFLPLRTPEGEEIPHYMLLNRRENRMGLFQTVKKEIVKEIKVPLIWKIRYFLGEEIYVHEYFEESKEDSQTEN